MNRYTGFIFSKAQHAKDCAALDKTGESETMAKVVFRQVGSALVAHLSGEIDHHAAEKLRQEIEQQLERRPVEQLCLDFGGVGFMDSSGVGLILGRARRMRAERESLRWPMCRPHWEKCWILQGSPTPQRRTSNETDRSDQRAIYESKRKRGLCPGRGERFSGKG